MTAARCASRRSIELMMAGTALCAVLLAMPGAPVAFESAHQTVHLIWNIDGADCTDLPLTLMEDHVWVGTAPVRGPATASPDGVLVYFKFMVDGSLQPAHYGQDVTRARGLVFGFDPPNAVERIRAFGYHTITLRELDLSYNVAGSESSIQAHIEYANTPLPIPVNVLAGTRVVVYDLDAGVSLGTHFYDIEAQRLPVSHVLPDRRYELTFSAPGYQSLTTVHAVAGPGASSMTVTLQKMVPTGDASWGNVKAQFR